MSKKYRIGIIGFAHMHINNVAALYAEHPQVEMVACSDTVPDVPELREAPYTRDWNVKNIMASLNVPQLYDDYCEMLDEEKLDILIKDPGAAGTPPAEFVGIPDIKGMVKGEQRLGGMGLYIIKELVDEAGFVEPEDEDDGNQFRMVIYRMDDDK